MGERDDRRQDLAILSGLTGVFDEPRFATYSERTKNITALYALIEEIASTKTSEEWLELLDENNIPAMRYNKIADVLHDPHLQQVDFWQERDGEKTGKYRTIKHPVHYSASPANIFADPPTLGADNEEIRGAIGMAANDQ